MTPAEFKTKFPQFSAESDERVQQFITDAEPFFDLDRWGDFYPAGVSNFVAHNLAIANYQAGGKNAFSSDSTMKKVGDVQVQNDPGIVSMKMKDPFARTTYGQQYRYYRSLIGPGALAV